MSLLIRRSRFSSCRQYVSVINTFREHMQPVSTSNVLNQIPSVSCKSFSLYASLFSPDAQVKKYFDYLMNVNKTQDWSKDNLAKMMDITKATDLLNERMHIMESINSLKDLVTDDAEMTKLMNAEELTYKTKLTEIDNKLMQRILEHLGNESYKNVILMISAGVGGQEAMLFVKDLYNMYIGYLEYLGLNYEIMELDKTEQGGLRIVNIIITGDKALVKLKYEGGVHRVQRIPSTEKSGRIHTSTVSVAILPEPANIEIHLDEKNLKIETKRASGPGGQHVNTTDSAVRVTHLPSGISVNCQIARTQHKNREWAISKIKSILYEQELNKQTSFLGSLRKKQMGLGLRNEKIRTYNYVQDRVTDHRLENGTVHNLPTFMMGGAALEKLEDRLHEDMQKKILMDILKMSEMQLK